jgi:NAD(P)H dehydrogenase (quinone)
MAELASEVSRQIGRDIPYRNLSGEDYAASLLGFGLPQTIVDVIIDADTKATRGDLDSTSHDLSGLISGPTTTLTHVLHPTEWSANRHPSYLVQKASAL